MQQELTAAFETMVRQALEPGRKLSADVLQLSSFYHAHPGTATPWEESFARPAYLSYFLPLNYARLRSVWREVERAQLLIDEIWDFGSGLGTTQWMLEDSVQPSVPLYCSERSDAAVEGHRRLHSARRGRFTPDFRIPKKPKGQSLAIFSYSFLEMQEHLPKLEEFEHVLIVEPSTRDCSRQLMEWRQRFLNQGFQVLAPCTHAEACPLLRHSERDWCHMRTGFAAPEWWLELEADLPMKNRTLTYSYLLISKSPLGPRPKFAARVIGDTLEERGKTRQMICRGANREFVSWLHRYGPPPRIPHGSLLTHLQNLESKGTELRVSPDHGLDWVE